MSRYLETSRQLGKEVENLLKLHFDSWSPDDQGAVAVHLGHIINLAVRCNPLQSPCTVRRSIVATAMGRYCNVTMTRELDEKSGREFNKIHIVSNQ